VKTGSTPGTTSTNSTSVLTVNAGATSHDSTVPPVRNRAALGLPTGYQVRPRMGSGHRSGAPLSVIASPTACTSMPRATAVPSHPAVPAVPPGTHSWTPQVRPAAMTSDGGPGTSASRPLIASAMQTNRVPSSTGVPQAAEARFTARPSNTAPAAVWVRPLWVPLPWSRRPRVRSKTNPDNGRTALQANQENTEKRRVAVDDGWSRSGSSAAPAHTAAKVRTLPGLGATSAIRGANPATARPSAAPDVA